MTLWDKKPKGYENISAEQAKMSGLFPGGNKHGEIDVSGVPDAANIPPSYLPTYGGIDPVYSRSAKRLFITGLPPNTTDINLSICISEYLKDLNVVSQMNPVKAVYLNDAEGYGFVEFSSADVATTALFLQDHLNFEGRKLQLSRPDEYVIPHFQVKDDKEEISNNRNEGFPDSPSKIVISNIPSYHMKEQVVDLLKSFGAINNFALVKKNGANENEGIAFVEYVDPSVTETVIDGLNGMDVGDKTLKVEKANVGSFQSQHENILGGAMGAVGLLVTKVDNLAKPSRVIQFLNMVTSDDLTDNDEYEEIMNDIKTECSKYGTVLDMKIPRPIGNGTQNQGVGRVFVRFETQEDADKALTKISGRKFLERTIVGAYLQEKAYLVNACK